MQNHSTGEGARWCRALLVMGRSLDFTHGEPLSSFIRSSNICLKKIKLTPLVNRDGRKGKKLGETS